VNLKKTGTVNLTLMISPFSESNGRHTTPLAVEYPQMKKFQEDLIGKIDPNSKCAIFVGPPNSGKSKILDHIARRGDDGALHHSCMGVHHMDLMYIFNGTNNESNKTCVCREETRKETDQMCLTCRLPYFITNETLNRYFRKERIEYEATNSPPFKIIRFRQNPFGNSGSAELARMRLLLWVLELPVQKTTICIDEPELFIPPGSVHQFVKDLLLHVV
jgi:hypothetical protein